MATEAARKFTGTLTHLGETTRKGGETVRRPQLNFRFTKRNSYAIAHRQGYDNKLRLLCAFKNEELEAGNIEFRPAFKTIIKFDISAQHPKVIDR